MRPNFWEGSVIFWWSLQVLVHPGAYCISCGHCCSCRIKSTCPLNRNCLAKETVYEAILKTSQKEYKYIGLTGAPFNTRYANHEQNFKKKSRQNATELSKLVCNLKDQNVDCSLTWKILAKKPTTSAGKKAATCARRIRCISWNYSTPTF